MSLKEALKMCFQAEPNRIFGIQDLCLTVQSYYTFSTYQMELDSKHPQPRYEHEIRSLISKLKKEHLIIRLGYNQYILA